MNIWHNYSHETVAPRFWLTLYMLLLVILSIVFSCEMLTNELYTNANELHILWSDRLSRMNQEMPSGGQIRVANTINRSVRR